MRGFDDLGVFLTHPGEQFAHGGVVLIGSIQLEEAGSADETGREHAVALEVVDGALNYAQVLIEERRHLARIRTLEQTKKLEDALARA